MGSATPHSGVESCVGPKTVVMGFPRIVVECLLALAERARGLNGMGCVYIYDTVFLHSILIFFYGFVELCRSREEWQIH